jgi:hypothetical protein
MNRGNELQNNGLSLSFVNLKMHSLHKTAMRMTKLELRVAYLCA